MHAVYCEARFGGNYYDVTIPGKGHWATRARSEEAAKREAFGIYKGCTAAQKAATTVTVLEQVPA